MFDMIKIHHFQLTQARLNQYVRWFHSKVDTGNPLLHDADRSDYRLHDIRHGCIFVKEAVDFIFKKKSCIFIIVCELFQQFILVFRLGFIFFRGNGWGFLFFFSCLCSRSARC